MNYKPTEVKLVIKRITQRDLLQWESNPHDFSSRCFSRTIAYTVSRCNSLNRFFIIILFMERINRTDLLQ